MLEYQGEGEKQNQGELAGCSRLADKCNQQRNWTALNGVLKLVELVLRRRDGRGNSLCSFQGNWKIVLDTEVTKDLYI